MSDSGKTEGGRYRTLAAAGAGGGTRREQDRSQRRCRLTEVEGPEADKLMVDCGGEAEERGILRPPRRLWTDKGFGIGP